MADSNEREANLEAGVRMMKTVDGIEYAFHWCPAGTFLMGSPKTLTEDDGWTYDETQHEVTLTRGFWMLETLVTVGMFRSFTKDTGYESQGDPPYGWDENGEELVQDSKYSWEAPGFSQDDAHPVVCVSWNDAVTFCKWLSEKTGLNVTLPTEAQWEYACRAGTTTPFSFGKTLNGDEANCDGTEPYGTDEKGPYLARTTPVRSYAPNAWGLYDMHGNAGEWCVDVHDDYPEEAVTDPISCPIDCNDDALYRVIRGGGWDFTANGCRSACRYLNSQRSREHSVGFRPVAAGE